MINWLQSFNMPDTLVVIGYMYLIVVLFYLLRLIKSGDLNNIFGRIMINIRSYYLLWLIISIPFLIFFIDQPLSQFFFDNRTTTVANILNFVNNLGEGWFVAGIILTILIISEFYGRHEVIVNIKMSLVAIIYAGIINTLLKLFFNRRRPSIDLSDPFAFFSFFQSRDHNVLDLIYASNSFPSGHAITVFAAITPFLLCSKDQIRKYFALFYALLICFARIYTQNHWLSDVVVGAYLGVLIGVSVYQIHLQKLIHDTK